LPWNFEHILETFHKHLLAGLSGAITVIRIATGENFRITIGFATELDDKGRQKATRILLVNIPEIKVKKGKSGQSCLTHVLDVLDD
jgi:hypothetical protein